VNGISGKLAAEDTTSVTDTSSAMKLANSVIQYGLKWRRFIELVSE
jgi:hypothetical protein